MVHQWYNGIKIFNTENGAALDDNLDEDGTVKDYRGIEFLDRHFYQVHRTIQEGGNLKGYFVWSLLDNFEWAWGYTRRFGMVYVDFITRDRILKDSAHWYKKVIG